MGVAQERYFYRLHELNPKEKDLIQKLFIQSSYGALKTANEQWLELFTALYDIKAQIQRQGLMSSAIASVFNEAALQLEESLHSAIEGQSKQYLDMLLKQDISFYEDEKAAMDFCLFFAMQYVRTPRILDNMRKNITEIKGIDVTKVWSVAKIIVATDIAWSMFVKRVQYRMSILTSNTSQFITGDQPIINTHAVDFEGTPESVEFFYPISPQLALLISESEHGKVAQIGGEKVLAYNEMMFKSSYKQVYAAQRADLEPFMDRSQYS